MACVDELAICIVLAGGRESTAPLVTSCGASPLPTFGSSQQKQLQRDHSRHFCPLLFCFCSLQEFTMFVIFKITMRRPSA